MTAHEKLDSLAVQLAQVRISSQHLQASLESLPISVGRMVAAFNELDNAGVFKEIDEHTGYEDPEQIIEHVRLS